MIDYCNSIESEMWQASKSVARVRRRHHCIAREIAAIRCMFLIFKLLLLDESTAMATITIYNCQIVVQKQ